MYGVRQRRRGGQLDRDLMLAECGSCGAVFSYAEQAGLAEDAVVERLAANPVLAGRRRRPG